MSQMWANTKKGSTARDEDGTRGNDVKQSGSYHEVITQQWLILLGLKSSGRVGEV